VDFKILLYLLPKGLLNHDVALAGDNLKQLAFCSVGSSLLILILFPLHLKK
jgi:hypothetical protein